MAIIDNSYIKASLELSQTCDKNIEIINKIANQLMEINKTPKIYQKGINRWVFEYEDEQKYPNYYIEINIGSGCVWCIKKSITHTFIGSDKDIFNGTRNFIKNVKEKGLCEL